MSARPNHLVVCATCGARYPAQGRPAVCRICADERQYVPGGQQSWTTPEELAAAGHRLRVELLERDLWRVTLEPPVAIRQRGYLLRTAHGAVLWDPPAAVDHDGLAALRAHRDVAAIAMSHPHYFGAMAEWADAFDCPILIAEEDAGWVTEPTPRVVVWRGEHEVLPGVRLIRCGGHFPGSAVLHREGLLLTGDTIQAVPAVGWVSFAYSYPNYLPLPAAEVERIAATVAPLPFTRLYGAFGHIEEDASAAIQRSADRYLALLRGDWPGRG